MSVHAVLLMGLVVTQALPTVDEILQRAVETAARYESLEPESRYTFRVTSRVERFDDAGRVRDTEERVLESDLVVDESEGLRFDEALVARFHVELEGVETVEGRSSYVLSFEPRSTQLPERGRLDRIVNRARGSMWIDVAPYEIARVRFELSEEISFMAGLLGRLSELKGELSRAPVAEDAWMPHHLTLRMKGRALLKRFHHVEDVTWCDFREAQP